MSAERTIVGIGAPSGGLEALEEIFRHVPSSTGASFVVVADDALDRIARSTSMRVVAVGEQTSLEPDSVYVADTGVDVWLDKSGVLAVDPDAVWPRVPVDRFFRSLAAEKGRAAVAVLVRDGRDDDGKLGALQIEAAGGTAFVQDAGTTSASLAGLLAERLGRTSEPARMVALKRAIAALVASKVDSEVLRIWTAGCATGEEAYALTALVHEGAAAADRRLAIRAFATDDDLYALEIARAGFYSRRLLAVLGRARVERFFTPEDGGYRVARSIRRCIVFGCHQLAEDPPFANIDLLSCPLALDGLDRRRQEIALGLVRRALRPGGLLVLGSPGAIDVARPAFTVVDERWGILAKA